MIEEDEGHVLPANSLQGLERNMDSYQKCSLKHLCKVLTEVDAEMVLGLVQKYRKHGIFHFKKKMQSVNQLQYMDLERKSDFLSWRWTHPAGQAGLVERLVCRNELGVTQQRHRQLGCYGVLKVNIRRKMFRAEG